MAWIHLGIESKIFQMLLFHLEKLYFMYLIAAFYVARLRINIVTNHQDDDRINKFRIFLEEAKAELFSIVFVEKRGEASREYQLQYQHQSMMLNYYTVFNAKTNYKENDNKMKYFYRRQRLFADRRVVYVLRRCWPCRTTSRPSHPPKSASETKAVASRAKFNRCFPGSVTSIHRP